MEKIGNLKEIILSKKYYLIGIIVITLFIVYFLCINNNNNEIVEEKLDLDNKNIEEPKNDICVVDIKGCVNNPGLYEVDCTSRINDIIKKAGDLTTDADTSVINLSKKVFDSMVLVIYSKEEVNNFLETKEKENEQNAKCKTNSYTQNDGCIDKKDYVEVNITVNDIEKQKDNIEQVKLVSINNATKEEFMMLPGIGEAKAIAIINYRNENGLFVTIDDIKNVSGIGDKMFEKIKNSITL